MSGDEVLSDTRNSLKEKLNLLYQYKMVICRFDKSQASKKESTLLRD